MAIYARYATANSTFKVGPFVDATDGVTTEGALSLAQADIRLSKADGAFAQKGDSGTCTHTENGWYTCPMGTADFGTLGRLIVHSAKSGCVPVFHEVVVLPQQVYDSLFAGSDVLQVDVAQWNNSNVASPATAGRPSVDAIAISGSTSAADNAETALTGGSYNVGGGGVVAASVSGAVGSVTGNVGGNVTGSVGSVSGAVGSVSGAVGSVTGNVGGNVTGSVGSLAAQAKADVNAEVVDVLNIDANAELSSVPAANASLGQKIAYVFQKTRNRITQTGSEQKLYADNGSTLVATRAISDDGTTLTEEKDV